MDIITGNIQVFLGLSPGLDYSLCSFDIPFLKVLIDHNILQLPPEHTRENIGSYEFVCKHLKFNELVAVVHKHSGLLILLSTFTNVMVGLILIEDS